MHGLPPDAANETHQDWVDRIHPDDRAATERQFVEAVSGTTRDYVARYRIVRPSDGETRWIMVRAEIERNDAGQPIRLVGAHSDVTEQVAAADALRESEELFRTLAEALPHHVWMAKPIPGLPPVVTTTRSGIMCRPRVSSRWPQIASRSPIVPCGSQ